MIFAISKKTIRFLTKSLKEIDKAIVKGFNTFYTALESVRVLGPVYSAGIFAEIGDIVKFSFQAQ